MDLQFVRLEVFWGRFSLDSSLGKKVCSFEFFIIAPILCLGVKAKIAKCIPVPCLLSLASLSNVI